MKNINIVIVGDGTVGKTCLLHTYNEGYFRMDYIPTTYDHEAKELLLDGERYMVTLHDTAGQEEYDRLRLLVYKEIETDAVILCYSSVDRDSFGHVLTKWAPEIRQNIPCVPIILVATKIDLRTATTNYVATVEGERLKKKIKAAAFVECSSKDFLNINDVVYEAIRATEHIDTDDDEETSKCFCCPCFSKKC